MGSKGIYSQLGRYSYAVNGRIKFHMDIYMLANPIVYIYPLNHKSRSGIILIEVYL